MKKIFTLLSAVALSAASFMMSAFSVQVGDYKGELKPEVMAALQSKEAAAKFSSEFNSNFNNGSNVVTRSYSDAAGNNWITQFLATGKKGTEAFTWQDKDGNIVPGPDWNEYPVYSSYLVFAVIECEGADNTKPDYAVQYALFWPSHYLWDQQFTYDGSLDENKNIPVEDRDYEIVPFEEFANGADFCRTFIEADPEGGYPYPEVNDAQTAYVSYPLLNIGGYYKKAGAQQSMNMSSGFAKGLIGKVDIMSADESYVNYEGVVAGIAKDNTQVNTTLIYEGTCRIDGFEHKDIIYPKLGGVHVFDCGVWNSAMLGFNTPWSEDFGDLHKYMVWGYDEYLKFMINEDDIVNTTNDDLLPGFDWRQDIENPVGTAEDHLNYFRFIFYSEKDGGLNNIWRMTFPVEVDDPDFGKYVSYAPTANCIIPYASEPQGCRTQGSVLMYKSYSYYPTDAEGKPTQLGIGTVNGFNVFTNDDYNNFITITYTDQIYFHNEPNDCNKYVMVNPVGDLEIDPNGAVEEVAVENAVVNAANGVVTVNGDVNVNIYTVDGAMVAAKKVNGVANFNLGKGLYIVKAGNVTKKVMLK